MDAGGGEPLTSVDAATEKVFRRTFFIMCVCFGLNHAAVTTPIGFATSILGAEVGNASNAVLYAVCMVSSLFLGPLFTSSLGPKNALVFGMILYVIYVFCFAAGTAFDPGAAGGWFFGCLGAGIGGIGAGSLWTAQGAFFGAIAENIADATGTPLQAVSAQLASTFAIWYLGQECFWKVLFTVLKIYTPLGFTILFAFYAVMALIATVVMFLGQDAKPKNAVARGPVCARAAAAVNMWSDPKIWLLAGSNVTFGFSAAYLGGYINANWQAQALGGGDFIGFLGAVIAAIATASSKVYGVAAEKMGTKMPIVVLGSLCFLGIGSLSLIQSPAGCLSDSGVATDFTRLNDQGGCDDGYHEGNLGPGGWGWGIVVFYVLQGMGRGVYESTNKGIFADFYPGDKSVGAFANCMMQNTAASAIAYIMGLAHVAKQELWILLLGGILTVPAMFLATKMKENSPVEEK